MIYLKLIIWGITQKVKNYFFQAKKKKVVKILFYFFIEKLVKILKSQFLSKMSFYAYASCWLCKYFL